MSRYPNNVAASNIETTQRLIQLSRCQYYHRTITVPFLDGILQHLATRFSQGQQKVLKGFSVIPAIMQEKGQSWRNDFKEFCTLCENALPSPQTVSVEMDIWEKK